MMLLEARSTPWRTAAEQEAHSIAPLRLAVLAQPCNIRLGCQSLLCLELLASSQADLLLLKC